MNQLVRCSIKPLVYILLYWKEIIIVPAINQLILSGGETTSSSRFWTTIQSALLPPSCCLCELRTHVVKWFLDVEPSTFPILLTFSLPGPILGPSSLDESTEGDAWSYPWQYHQISIVLYSFFMFIYIPLCIYIYINFCTANVYLYFVCIHICALKWREHTHVRFPANNLHVSSEKERVS